MTDKPLISTPTAVALDAALKRLPHALALVGKRGSGVEQVSTWFIASVLGVPQASIANHPYVLHIGDDDATTIGIDAVRVIEKKLSLRMASNKRIARVVIIHGADRLSTEAQNALLKTLEEPPAQTMLVLITNDMNALLATVRSRLQAIELVLPLANEILTSLVAAGASTEQATKLMQMSGGLPELAHALHSNADHPLLAAAQSARELLQQSTFERIAQVDTLAKAKPQAANVLFMLEHMSHAALATGRSSERWYQVLEATYQAQADLLQGVQPKLALTNLMLKM